MQLGDVRAEQSVCRTVVPQDVEGFLTWENFKRTYYRIRTSKEKRSAAPHRRLTLCSAVGDVAPLIPSPIVFLPLPSNRS